MQSPPTREAIKMAAGYPRDLIDDEALQPGDRIEITDTESGDVRITTYINQMIPEFHEFGSRYSFRILYRRPTLNLDEENILKWYRALKNEKERGAVRNLLSTLSERIPQ